MENKLIANEHKDFHEVTLNHVLRNTSMNVKLVNHIRQTVMGNYEDKLLLPGMGHCVDGLFPKIYFGEKIENPSIRASDWNHSWTTRDGHPNPLPISIRTFVMYEKLPNIVLSAIIEMFRVMDEVSFQDMILQMIEILVHFFDHIIIIHV